MHVTAEHDVVILGAGPGGASAAIRLAQLGFDVGIVERDRFPREHVGICISDETVALIEYLGLDNEFNKARFWRRNLTATKWGQTETSFTPQPGYHLNRGVLDQLLLQRSRSAGVRLYQPARVQEVERLNSSGWCVTVVSAERLQFLNARFIVDAAGRRAAIRGPRNKDGPPLLTLYASWHIEKAPAFDGLIEAGENAWLWYAQTSRDRAVVSVFCDPRRPGVSKKNSVRDWYIDLLRQFQALEQGLLGQLCSNPKACDATSRHADDPIGDDYIRVGDACLTVDPLSSQGVHLALQSGLQGAIIVNTLLKKPENTEAAQRFFRMRATERVSRYAARTRQEYSRVAAICTNPFWNERATDSSKIEGHGPYQPYEPTLREPSGQVALSHHATFDAEPVIDGNYVEVRRVLKHPGIEGGIAYVEGFDLNRLLSILPPRIVYSDIPTVWRSFVAPATGSKIALWLWNRGVLVKAT